MEQFLGDSMVKHPYKIGSFRVRYLVELLRYLASVDHLARHRGRVLQRIGTEEAHLVARERLEHVPRRLDLGTYSMFITL